jgi:hypothetical protein
MIKPCEKCGKTDRKPGGDCRPCAAKYAALHREQKKAANAAWYLANSEKVKASGAAYRAANPGRVRAISAAYRIAKPEQVKASFTAWQSANPENRKARDHKRRAMKKAAGGSFTATDIKSMFKQQKGKCIVCKTDITNSYHIDHIMPLALGGHNGIQNIQLLCQRCNQGKHAKHPIDWMQENGFLL